MKNNKPDLYASEASVIGDEPKGAKAEDKIELTITAANDQDISINAKKEGDLHFRMESINSYAKQEGATPLVFSPYKKNSRSFRWAAICFNQSVSQSINHM